MQAGKLVQNVGHLVAALAAADINDNVGVGPFCELMLDDGLPAAKGSRDRRYAANRDREKRVNHALSRHHRLPRRQLLFIRPGFPHGPLLQHRDFFFLAVVSLDAGDNVGNRRRSLAYPRHGSLRVLRNHDFVKNDGRFLNFAEDVARHHAVAFFRNRFKIPFALAV